jgi:V/A-type H+-transporting ATPase subunit A
MVEGRILKVSGPLVIAEGMREANMFDVVRVGKDRLIGEIIEMHGDRASIQVYEETAGLGRGDKVVSTGSPLSVELGPGLIRNIYDGIQRPLEVMRQKYGANILRGIDESALDRDKRWFFKPAAAYGDHLRAGDVFGYVQETSAIRHKLMVPQGYEGTVAEIHAGQFTVTDTVAQLRCENGEILPLCMMQKWPVRRARPIAEKLAPS